MDSLRLLSKPEDVEGAILAGLDWSDEITFCSSAVDFRLGQWPLAAALVAHSKKIDRAYVGIDGMASEPHALEALHTLGVLRLIPAADGSFRPHVFRFIRGDHVRVVLGGGRLVPSGLMAPFDATVVWEGGASADFAIQVERLFERAREVSHVPELEQLRQYAGLHAEGAEHRDRLTELGAPFIRRQAFDAGLDDLELVTDAKAIRKAIEAVKEQLLAASTWKGRQWIGFHGGSVQRNVHWSSALKMWALFDKLDNRYWNCFGVDRPPSEKALRITVEVNPPLEGIDRKIGGAIARQASTGRLYFLHRGRIGGGQKGIGSDLFWTRFRGVPLKEGDAAEPSRVVVVGEIGSASFARDVAAFVHEVRRIKEAAS